MKPMPIVFYWLWKNKIHFFVLALVAVYLLSANLIYTTFFLKNGKPLKNPPSLPSQTTEMVFEIAKLENILYDGEEIYEMRGYAFAPTFTDSAEFKKTLVLHSTGTNLFFPANQVNVYLIFASIPKYEMNLNNSGFRVLISKNILKTGNYQVGFLLESKDGFRRIYRQFDIYIERYQNRLRLISDP